MLKILHTSDWHLGKKLFKRERHEEQEIFLNTIRQKIKDENISILIIAGDIFDSPIPPTKSLRLFFEFLGFLESDDNSLEHIFAIGGNHDNGALLESPRPFLNPDFFKIVGTMDHEEYRNYGLVTKEGVLLCGLPFFRPRDLFRLEIPQAPSFDSLQEDLLYRLQWWLENLKKSFNCPDAPSILIGHHLFGSFQVSGSELGVGLSGLETLPLSYFSDWDILALGHIHKPQCVKKEGPSAYYSGSPYPLRFSESNEKKMLLYTWQESEGWSIEWQDIPIIRPLLRLKGTESELIQMAKDLTPQGVLSPFVEITLNEADLSPAKIEELRTHFLEFNFEVINIFSKSELRFEKESEHGEHIQNLSTEELFQLFLKEYDLAKEEEKNLLDSFTELQEVLRDSDALS
jgi:exonuclease SbcD